MRAFLLRGLLAFLFPFTVFLVHLPLFFFGMYTLYPWIDIPMHFFGGCSIAIGLVIISRTRFSFLTVLVLTLFVALLWELFEFSVDILFGLTFQISTQDTITDLLFGVMGGTIGFFSISKCLKDACSLRKND